MFELKSIHELVQIAAAGGGFSIKANLRPTMELVQLAAAAARSGARLELRGLKMRSVPELIQISAAGKGCIIFVENLPED